MTTLSPPCPCSALAAAGTPVTIDGLPPPHPQSGRNCPPPPMRFKQFTIPAAAGDQNDAELVIFFFGPGQGGGTDANLTRWKGMFDAARRARKSTTSPRSRPSRSAASSDPLDVSGTYKYKPSMHGPRRKSCAPTTACSAWSSPAPRAPTSCASSVRRRPSRSTRRTSTSG